MKLWGLIQSILSDLFAENWVAVAVLILSFISFGSPFQRAIHLVEIVILCQHSFSRIWPATDGHTIQHKKS